MRRIVLFAIVLTLLAGTRAEAQPEVSVRGNVGASFFQSPEGLSSVLNSGIDLGVGTSVQIYRGLELVLEGGYSRFTLNEDNVALSEENLEVGASSTIEGGDLSLLHATVGARYVFRSQGDAQPYVSSGVGLYRTRITELRASQNGERVGQNPERTSNSPGVHFALGVDFRVNETYDFFFEPQYVVVYADDQELRIGRSTHYIPVRLGIDVDL